MGPISHRLNREVWRLVRQTARTTRSRGVLHFAGPLATVTMLMGWLAGLWVGFALIYLPFVAHFSSSVHTRPSGLFAALYASATMLTTLGIGDLLPIRNGMRVAIASEAGLGVATVSAAISYILSVYPLTTQTRAHALRFSDLHVRSPTAARAFIAAAGLSGLASLHQQLIDSHQSLRRFPVLYYFHPQREEESVKRLLESATILCIVARWARPAELPGYTATVACGLQATLTRVRRDYETRYIGGRSGAPEREHPPDEQLRATLRSLREQPYETAAPTDPTAKEVKEFEAFLTAMERFLAGLSRSQLYHHEPLLHQLSARSAQP